MILGHTLSHAQLIRRSIDHVAKLFAETNGDESKCPKFVEAFTPSPVTH